MAERAFITRTTLGKIEKGDPGVSIGNYAAVLHALGLADRIGEIVDPATDRVGQLAEEYSGPKRIRRPKSVPPKAAS